MEDFLSKTKTKKKNIFKIRFVEVLFCKGVGEGGYNFCFFNFCNLQTTTKEIEKFFGLKIFVHHEKKIVSISRLKQPHPLKNDFLGVFFFSYPPLRKEFDKILTVQIFGFDHKRVSPFLF